MCPAVERATTVHVVSKSENAVALAASEAVLVHREPAGFHALHRIQPLAAASALGVPESPLNRLILGLASLMVSNVALRCLAVLINGGRSLVLRHHGMNFKLE